LGDEGGWFLDDGGHLGTGGTNDLFLFFNLFLFGNFILVFDGDFCLLFCLILLFSSSFSLILIFFLLRYSFRSQLVLLPPLSEVFALRWELLLMLKLIVFVIAVDLNTGQ